MRPTVPSFPTQSKRLTISCPELRPKTPSSSLALSIWSGSSAIIGNNGRRSRRAENAEDSERISLSDTAVAIEEPRYEAGAVEADSAILFCVPRSDAHRHGRAQSSCRQTALPQLLGSACLRTFCHFDRNSCLDGAFRYRKEAK